MVKVATCCLLVRPNRHLRSLQRVCSGASRAAHVDLVLSLANAVERHLHTTTVQVKSKKCFHFPYST